MSDTAFWGLIGAFIGAAITLFGTYIAQSNGLALWHIAKQEHGLNLRKAAPILNTSVRIEQRQVNSASYPPYHFILATIHNNGSLAAQKLEGHWRIYSPTNAINESRIPISINSLGPVPYDLNEVQLIGANIDNALKRGEGTFGINVEIEFDYTGMSEDRKEEYRDYWEYDRTTKQMKRTTCPKSPDAAQ